MLPRSEGIAGCLSVSDCSRDKTSKHVTLSEHITSQQSMNGIVEKFTVNSLPYTVNIPMYRNSSSVIEDSCSIFSQDIV
jgi:hypothetical protein